MAILMVRDIIPALEEKHRTDLPHIRVHLSKLLREYPQCREMRACFINDGNLLETVEEAHEKYDGPYEFIYERLSGMIISGIAWHNDFVRELYRDLFPKDFETVGFNDFADHLFEEKKVWGFKSSVSSVFMHEFSMSTKEKIFFSKFLPAQY